MINSFSQSSTMMTKNSNLPHSGLTSMASEFPPRDAKYDVVQNKGIGGNPYFVTSRDNESWLVARFVIKVDLASSPHSQCFHLSWSFLTMPITRSYKVILNNKNIDFFQGFFRGPIYLSKVIVWKWIKSHRKYILILTLFLMRSTQWNFCTNTIKH